MKMSNAMNTVATLSAKYVGDTIDGFVHGHRYKITVIQQKNEVKVTRCSIGVDVFYDSIAHFFMTWTGVETLFSDTYMRKETRDRVLTTK